MHVLQQILLMVTVEVSDSESVLLNKKIFISHSDIIELMTHHNLQSAQDVEYYACRGRLCLTECKIMQLGNYCNSPDLLPKHGCIVEVCMHCATSLSLSLL